MFFTAKRNYSEYELVTKSNFLKYRDFNAVLVDELVNERQSYFFISRYNWILMLAKGN